MAEITPHKTDVTFSLSCLYFLLCWQLYLVNAKKAGGSREKVREVVSIWPLAAVFPKMFFLERGLKPEFLWILILSLAKSSLKTSWKLIQSFRRYQDFLFQYQLFSLNFWKIWNLLVAKKLLTSAYDRLCQNFFYFQPTLNSLFNYCIKFCLY